MSQWTNPRAYILRMSTRDQWRLHEAQLDNARAAYDEHVAKLMRENNRPT